MRSPAKVLLTLGALAAGAAAAAASEYPRLQPDQHYGEFPDGTDFVRTADGYASLVDGAIDSEGRLVALVIRRPADGAPIVPRLERRTTRGLPDDAFGAGGAAELPVFADWQALLVDSQGRLVVLGRDLAEPAIRVARFDGEGALDPSFGDGGVTGPLLSTYADLSDARVDTLGRVVFASKSGDGQPAGWAIVRLTVDGAPDPAFGVDGRVVVPDIAIGAFPRIAIDSANRIVVAAGWSLSPDALPAKVVRLLEDGAADPAFGDAGAVDLGAGAERTLTDDAGRVVLLTRRVAPDGTLGLTFMRLGEDGALDLSWGRDRDGFADLPGYFGISSLVATPSAYVLQTYTTHATTLLFQVSTKDGSVFAGNDATVDFDVEPRARRVLDADGSGVYSTGLRTTVETQWYVARFRVSSDAGSDVEVVWKSQPERHGRSVTAAYIVRNRGTRASERGTVTVAAPRIESNDDHGPVVLSRAVPPMKPGRAKVFRMRVRGQAAREAERLVITMFDPGSHSTAPNDVASSAPIPLPPDEAR